MMMRYHTDSQMAYSVFSSPQARAYAHNMLPLHLAPAQACMEIPLSKVVVDSSWEATIARWYGKKIIIHQHGGNIKEFYFHQCSPRQQKRIRKTLLQAEKLLVIAPYLQEIFEQIVDKDRIVLLPNAMLIPDKVKKDYRGQKL